MNDLTEKYRAYIEFANHWRQLNDEDKVVLQRHFLMLEQSWKAALITNRKSKSNASYLLVPTGI